MTQALPYGMSPARPLPNKYRPVGFMVMDHNTLTIRIWDGTTWLLITEEAREHNMIELLMVTDKFLLDKYKDLSDLEIGSDEYIELINKYRTFEILAKETY